MDCYHGNLPNAGFLVPESFAFRAMEVQQWDFENEAVAAGSSGTLVRGKCMTQPVLTVGQPVRFPSSQRQESRSTVETVTPSASPGFNAETGEARPFYGWYYFFFLIFFFLIFVMLFLYASRAGEFCPAKFSNTNAYK